MAVGNSDTETVAESGMRKVGDKVKQGKGPAEFGWFAGRSTEGRMTMMISCCFSKR